VNFSDLGTLSTTDGEELGFIPNNPAGAALLSGSLCIATSNGQTFNPDPLLSTFYDGTIVCFPYRDGNVETASVRVATTSGENATGVGVFDGEFVVVSSNSYNVETGRGAFVDLFDPATLERTSIGLGAITAQIAPTVAITDGGLALIGVYSRPQLITVDLATREIDRTWDLNAGSELDDLAGHVNPRHAALFVWEFLGQQTTVRNEALAGNWEAHVDRTDPDFEHVAGLRAADRDGAV